MNPLTRSVLALGLGFTASMLAACGGDSTSLVPPPVVIPPSVTLVRVSQASPYKAGCGGALFGSVSYQDAEVEPYFAVNPTNPSNLIGVWQQDRWSDGGSHGLVAGYSMDGGKHWKEKTLLMSHCAGGDSANGANYARASDPWVTFAPDGTAYAISISFSGEALQLGSKGSVLVVRSADGGVTWSAPVTLITDGDTTFSDKESITADPTDFHFIYAVWDRLTATGFGAAYFARTTDAGAIWELAKVIYDPGLDNQTIGNEIVVLPDGTLVDLFEEIDGTSSGNATGRIRVIRSLDQGVTWSTPITVARNFAVGTVDPETGALIRVGAGLPQMAADPSGGLAVVWQDGRFSGGAYDGIALARSSDSGLHWSAPVQINSAANAAAFTPSVAVLSDGTIGVSFFDFRNDTADTGTLPTDYWFTSSVDGVHWSEKHITGPFDMHLAPEAEGLFIGDYQGLGVEGGVFVPFFVQTNGAGTGNRNDAYFLPPQPIPLIVSRRVTNLARSAVTTQPDPAFAHRVHENLMRLLADENPGWEKILEQRHAATAPP